VTNTGQPPLALGATGDSVRWAQRALRRAQCTAPPPVDGIFGPETARAVREFQQRARLAVNGRIDRSTWEELPDGAPMPVLREGSRGEIVRRLQAVLAEGGVEPAPGAVDGCFGAHTRAAVEAAQREAQLAVDGVLGDTTWGARVGGSSAPLELAVGLAHAAG
jgi:peptidoglycan hydrolase-like protein with peptidoglycan-binding domain